MRRYLAAVMHVRASIIHLHRNTASVHHIPAPPLIQMPLRNWSLSVA